ncbi:hypothetical protein MASR1M74_00810 [Lentimicrobium sp.]
MLTSCEKETVLPASEVPAEITTYVKTHFSDHKILQVIKDKDGFTKTYDVILEGGFSLEFDRKLEIIEIDGSSRLPDSVIPAKILDYVNQNYSGIYITDWETDGKNQQVGLENELELEFNMSGEFLRIDG